MHYSISGDHDVISRLCLGELVLILHATETECEDDQHKLQHNNSLIHTLLRLMLHLFVCVLGV